MSDDLRAENAELRRRLDACMHAGDMEHARMAALLNASQDMLNQLALLTRDDSAALWRIGGNPLQDAKMALKRATAAVRPQADALLKELEAARAVVSAARRHIADSGIDRDDRALMDAIERYEQQRARTE